MQVWACWNLSQISQTHTHTLSASVCSWGSGSCFLVPAVISWKAGSSEVGPGLQPSRTALTSLTRAAAKLFPQRDTGSPSSAPSFVSHLRKTGRVLPQHTSSFFPLLNPHTHIIHLCLKKIPPKPYAVQDLLAISWQVHVRVITKVLALVFFFFYLFDDRYVQHFSLEENKYVLPLVESYFLITSWAHLWKLNHFQWMVLCRS